MSLNPRILLPMIPLLVFSLAPISCTQKNRISVQYGRQFTQTDIEQVIKENPLGPRENIKVTTLGKTAEVSHHVVQIRDREVPHLHRSHDLTVVLFRGRGYLMLENKKVDLAEGDVVFVPRRTVHYFVNTSPWSSAGLAIFAPAFDGKDTIPVSKP